MLHDLLIALADQKLTDQTSLCRYFRHAWGSLLVLSKNLAQYINVNRLAINNQQEKLEGGLTWMRIIRESVAQVILVV